MNFKFSSSLIVCGPIIPNQEILKVIGAHSLSEQMLGVWKFPLPLPQWVLLDGPAPWNLQDFKSSKRLSSPAR